MLASAVPFAGLLVALTVRTHRADRRGLARRRQPVAAA
jgi:hypothetical protein